MSIVVKVLSIYLATAHPGQSIYNTLFNRELKNEMVLKVKLDFDKEKNSLATLCLLGKEDGGTLEEKQVESTPRQRSNTSSTQTQAPVSKLLRHHPLRVNQVPLLLPLLRLFLHLAIS